MRHPLPLIAFATLPLAPPPAMAASRTHTVVIDKMAFALPAQTIHVGDRIVWVNKDLFRHTATALDKSFDVDLPPGASRVLTLRKAGSIPVSCRYHPGMRAMLNVSE